jgi:hypothetical protein
MPPRSRNLTVTQRTASNPRPPQSDGDDSDVDSRDAPVLISPVKARAARKGIANKPDHKVMQLSDKEILGTYRSSPLDANLSDMVIFDQDASKATWTSKAYDHYNVSIRRDNDEDGEPSVIQYVFKCKNHSVTHDPHIRARMATGNGTANLLKGRKACLVREGELQEDKDANLPPNKYTPAAFRANIALQCAKNNRPFNFVLDPNYKEQVNMLCLNTHVPSPATVSRDINAVYVDMARHVRQYLMV